MNHICDNCYAEYTEETLHEVIGRLHERLDPGGLVPSGECTSCGSLVYPEKHVVLGPAEVEDLFGLCSGVMAYERDDFITVLLNEPLYVEEGIITEKEVEELTTVPEKRAREIVDKAAKNPEMAHVYALAYRLLDKIKHIEVD